MCILHNADGKRRGPRLALLIVFIAAVLQHRHRHASLVSTAGLLLRVACFALLSVFFLFAGLLLVIFAFASAAQAVDQDPNGCNPVRKNGRIKWIKRGGNAKLTMPMMQQ